MKQTLTHLFSLFLIPLVAAHGADAPTENAAAGLKFRVQQLHLDNNEGCAIEDFNKDGKLDISAGVFWRPGPDFKTQKPLRKLSPQPPDYLTNNGEHAWDVNGDGWPDIVSGSFMDTAICWYENPKAGGLAKGDLWKKHVLIDTKLKENEATEFRDLDGDAVPELIVNSWNVSHPAMAYKLAKNDQGEPILNPWVIHESGGRVNGHGMGFGDINGDDLEDIIFGNGWYERPKQDAATKPWILHNDWNFPGASCPMLVVAATTSFGAMATISASTGRSTAKTKRMAKPTGSVISSTTASRSRTPWHGRTSTMMVSPNSLRGAASRRTAETIPAMRNPVSSTTSSGTRGKRNSRDSPLLKMAPASVCKFVLWISMATAGKTSCVRGRAGRTSFGTSGSEGSNQLYPQFQADSISSIHAN